MEFIYNSRLSKHKTPFGALKAGENACFKLFVPQYLNCTSPFMFLKPDNKPARKIPLDKTGEEDGRDIFTCELSVDAPGLYFYWFDLWTDYKKIYRGIGGQGMVSQQEGELYQLTVYDPCFTTPKDVRGGVMYQIFPDRFFEGHPNKEYVYNERIYRADKSKEPYFWPTDQIDGKLTLDYFGGDLAGIEQKLPFLHSLGVTWLYLNPIFEAHSNHRYNTADYMNIDPYLGTNEDFERLCKKAHKFGIRIILDGVFSHTGSDSIYFNREGRYPSFGAWQGPESPYRDWYHFHPDGGYDSWWGFDTLPETNKQNHEYTKFICGEGGVIETWLERGAAGFRLDVADELSDDFIVEIRKAVKRCGEDKLLIGEVWEDASNKMSYGGRRRYFYGEELDGVMNYPFANAIIHYTKYHDPIAFRETVMNIAENYPEPALSASTTHLSTHDSLRFITAVAGDDLNGHDRDWQSMRRLTVEQYQLGIVRLKLGFVLQFTLPGIPCVYYGDEIAMQGYKDPFNRAYYNWNSAETGLIPLMMELSALRKKCHAFKSTYIKFTLADDGMIAFERKNGNSVAAIGVNCSNYPASITLLGQNVNVPVMGFSIRTSEGFNIN